MAARDAPYPVTVSRRYPPEDWDRLKAGTPANNIGGKFLNDEGDVRTWLIDSHVETIYKRVVAALAHLDLLDGRTEQLRTAVAH